MGDGQTRIVDDPASKATGYGINAAVDTANRALGIGGVVRTAAQAASLRAAVASSPAEWWVVKAQAIWDDVLAAEDPSLKGVQIADLDWWAEYASKLSGKPAIAELGDVGYPAWTNSSSLTLVAPSLFGEPPDPADDTTPRLLLKHEAEHIKQFRREGDQPPRTYLDMARFERDAYGRLLVEVNRVIAAGATEYADLADAVGQLVTTFGLWAAHPPGRATEEFILAAMLLHEDNGQPSAMLPPSAGPTPDNMYVP